MLCEVRKTTIQLYPEDYEWFWAERRPGESFKRAFSRLRAELEAWRIVATTKEEKHNGS